MLDGEGRIADTNRVVERVIGDSEGVIGRSADTVFDDWGELLDGTDDGTAHEERAVEVGGEERWIEGRRSPVGSGQVGGQVLLLRDVTDRHRRERRPIDRERDSLSNGRNPSPVGTSGQSSVESADQLDR